MKPLVPASPGDRPTRPDTVLVMAPNWLGDCVMALPVIEALRTLDRPVAVAARKNILPLFAALETGASHLIEAPRGGFRGAFGDREFVMQTRDISPGTAVILPNSYSSALHVWKAGVPLRVGAAFRPARSLLLSRTVSKQRYLSFPHQAQRYLSLLEPLGFDTPRELPQLEERVSAQAVSAAEALDLPAHFAVLAPEAAYGPAKEWPPEYFARVAGGFRDLGLSVVLTGMGKDRERIAPILSVEGVLDLRGKTDIPALAGVFSRAEIFVGNDSGAAHLAAAAGTPSVVIFGSTDPEATRPLGTAVRALREPLPCSPCFRRTCPLGTTECLRKITPEKVLSVAEEMLRSRR